MKAKLSIICLAALLMMATINRVAYAVETTAIDLQSLLKKGELYFNQGRYKEAEKYFKTIAETAKGLGDIKIYAISSGYLGYTQVLTNHLDDAEATLKQAEQEAIAANLPLARSLAYKAYVQLYAERGDMLNEHKYIVAILNDREYPFADKESYRELLKTTQMVQKTLTASATPGNTDDYYKDALFARRVMHWRGEGQTVKVYAESMLNVLASNPAYVQNFKKACLVWQGILKNQVQFEFVQNPNNADVVVDWKASRGTTKTNYSINGDKLLQMTIDLYLIGPGEVYFNPETVYRIALHETGHVLGIAGHSQNPNDIMYPSLAQAKEPSARDIATLQKLYSQPAKITNPKGITLSDYRQQVNLKASYSATPWPNRRF